MPGLPLKNVKSGVFYKNIIYHSFEFVFSNVILVYLSLCQKHNKDPCAAASCAIDADFMRSVFNYSASTFSDKSVNFVVFICLIDLLLVHGRPVDFERTLFKLKCVEQGTEWILRIHGGCVHLEARKS